MASSAVQGTTSLLHPALDGIRMAMWPMVLTAGGWMWPFCVAHPFWKDWRKLVKSINPEAYLTAEVIDTPEALKPYLEGDEFDAVMNYGFKMTAFRILCQRNPEVPQNTLSAGIANPAYSL